jgi:glycosyltransferase involved in cell wall biosynthesis
VIHSKKKIYYIVESIEWSTNWDGRYIVGNVKRLFNQSARVVKTSRLMISRIKGQIIHFGSRNTYLPYNYKYVNKDNDIILTWFHGTDKDLDYIRLLPEVSKKRLSMLHTSCTITREQLIKWGAAGEKIKIIPIGVDIDLFKKASTCDSKEIRKRLGIPEGAVCIGSFQKDGEGWREGNSPKLIKGPDIFCDVMERLKEKYPIFILLIGPARGYVKNRLVSSGIPFRHLYLRNYLNIAKFYKALDLYLISSRAEGGPKALLESFASGVPVISTDVGMVHDVAENGRDAMVCRIDDVEDLVYNCQKIIDSESLRKKIIENGFKTVKDLDWKIIARRYYEQIYSKFL